MKVVGILFRVIIVSAFVAIFAGAALLAMIHRDLTSFGKTPFGTPEEKIVDVPQGANPRQIVRLLTRGGVLSDEQRAWWYVRFVKRDSRQMRAGEYGFAGPLQPDDVLEKLYRGEVKTYRFTVPEGLRMEEIAAIVEAAKLGTARELVRLMRDAALAKELGVPGRNLEGFLFPDTYAFARDPKPRAILTAMLGRYRDAWRKAEAERSPSVTLGEQEAVTLASIVEKETGHPEERPHISCVFHNRLRLGMPLQTDPTVMYATMLRNHGRWSQNITKADLTTPHPYNTYTTKGLPPGPIASPGAASLRAALNPSACRDLYFVSKNDGTHVFCPDLRCHQSAVKKWQIDYFKASPRVTPRHRTRGVTQGAKDGRRR